MVAAVVLLTSCKGNKGESAHVEYIAHAGGIINGSSYTNSLEAVDTGSLYPHCLDTISEFHAPALHIIAAVRLSKKPDRERLLPARSRAPARIARMCYIL